MKLVPEEPQSKLGNLQPRPYLLEDPEDLSHLEWSGSHEECVVATSSVSTPDEIEERKQKQVRSEAIDTLLRLRREQGPVSDQEIARIRDADRP
jgi:hypothetical protein